MLLPIWLGFTIIVGSIWMYYLNIPNYEYLIIAIGIDYLYGMLNYFKDKK